MKSFFKTVAIFSGLTTIVAAPAAAQGAVFVDFQTVKVSGGTEFVSQYALRDAFVATPGPANQGYGSVSFGEVSANVWYSKGIETSVGDELDLGVAWKRELGNDSSVKLVYNRYFINDAPDMDEYTVTYSTGDFDASYTYYTWHEGMEDGQRINGGYNYAVDDKLSGRFDLTAETGLGLSDSLVVGADLNYAITDNLTLGGTVLVPFTKKDDGRDTIFVANIGYAFKGL